VSYLHIGQNVMIPDRRIIGIFDLDNCSQSFLTREFLSAAEKAGQVVNAAEDIPNSFLICAGQKERSNEESCTVYLSQSSSRTLEKRIHQMQTERRNTCRK
jgi:hypothetical protein